MFWAGMLVGMLVMLALFAVAWAMNGSPFFKPLDGEKRNREEVR